MAHRGSQLRASTTAWHPLLAVLIEQLAPPNLKVQAEFLLNKLPLRVDIVVLRQDRPTLEPPRKLRSIFDNLREHTLIEFKGPTDDLQAADVAILMAYAGQYAFMHDIVDPERMCLMVMADRMSQSFIEQVERQGGSFVPGNNGVWHGHLGGWPLLGVELRKACRRGSSEWLLYMFTRSYLTNPWAILESNDEVDEEDVELYSTLCTHVEQFRRHRSTMNPKAQAKAEEQFQKSFKVTIKDVLKRFPPEYRLAGLTAEEILSALPPRTLAQLKRKLNSQAAA